MSALALPLLYAGLAAVAYGALIALRTSASTHDATASYGDALSLRAALILAATFGVILLAAAAMRAWFGDNGILVAAAITGLADAHATAVSAASLAASGMISDQTACLPVLIGLTTNTLTKSVLAFTSGNRPFAWRILPGFSWSWPVRGSATIIPFKSSRQNGESRSCAKTRGTIARHTEFS